MVATSSTPPQKRARTARKSSSCGAARANRVIDERNFQGVDPSEEFLGRRDGRLPHGPGDLPQPCAEHAMRQVRPGLAQICHGVLLSHGAAAKPGQLREDEPHPMADLAARSHLGQSPLVDPTRLGRDEPVQIEWIAHGAIVHRGGGVRRGWWAGFRAVRRRMPYAARDAARPDDPRPQPDPAPSRKAPS